MSSKKFHIACPHCQAKISLDSSTGEILASEEVKTANKVSMEERLKALDEDKARSDAIFSQQMDALKDKDRLLEEKFKEAMEKSKDADDKRPIRDIDLD